jgi:hypothetical protein
MKDPALLARLDRIHDLLSGAFVRYLLEAAGPRTESEADGKALEALRAWDAACVASLARIEEILAAEKAHPLPPPWNLEFSQYHYLSAAYLLGPAARRMEPLLPALEAEAAGLEGWPEAHEAAARAVEEMRRHLGAVRDLDASLPRTPPKPAAKKGVSASRW